MANNPLRNIPSVNELIEMPPLRRLMNKVSHNLVVNEVRSFLDELRGDLQSRATELRIPTANELADRIAHWIVQEHKPKLRPVINATGIVLHTGLGRSPLAQEAIEEVRRVAEGYSSVEVDLDTGMRSQRVLSVQKLLCDLTGAQAALVVNNNAGATLLTLAALATRREVIVSRAHLVEIGGSYRLPEVMSASGAILREVGTTNKTRIDDFAQAVGDLTGALMRVHPSNYVISGFTEQPSLQQLVDLGREHRLPVIDDIGSGALLDLDAYGLKDEPLARDSMAVGADVALFSGDKLLGGPQCGVIVGRTEPVNRILRHPLTRALRVDKMTLAALHATLRLYHTPDQAQDRVPLLRLLTLSVENLENRARRLAEQMMQQAVVANAEAVQDVAYLGGGSVPTQQMPTWCVALTPHNMTVDSLAKRLRLQEPAVFGRIQKDRLLLDLKAVFPEQDMLLAQCVARLKSIEDREPQTS